jgi:hypothetical protein
MAQTNSPPQAQSFRSGYAENSAPTLRYLYVSAVNQTGDSIRFLINELFATYLINQAFLPSRCSPARWNS